MKIKKLDSYVEKSIITAMIVSTDFLQGFEYLYKNELFQIPYAKIIARWCWDYYETYTEAPNKTIQAIYKKNSEKLDEALCEAIELFLDKLSTEYDRDSNFNTKHILDQAEEYFQKRNTLALKDEIQVCINNNDTKAAELAIAGFNQLETPTGSGLDLYKDSDQIASFFGTNNDSVLFTFKGVAGTIIPPLRRKEFMRFDAPEKRGKCSPAASLVYLADGSIKTIGEIINRGLKTDVVSYDINSGKFATQKITNHFCNGKKRVYKIITRTGREIKLTRNHPLLTMFGWEPVKELNPGNHIAVPKSVPFFGKETTEPYKLDALAYLITEGTISQTTYYFSKKHKKTIEYFSSVVDKFNDSLFISKSLTHTISRGNIKKWFAELGLDGKRSKDKFIPDFIFRLKKHLIKRFLQVMFDCDGSIEKTGTVSYSSASERMIRQVQHLLSRFGIVSKIRDKPKKGISYYELTIRDKANSLLFEDKIGFFLEKQERAKLIWDKLRKKTEYSFLDTIPYEFIFKRIKPVMDKYTFTSNWSNCPVKGRLLESYSHAVRRKGGLTRNKTSEIVNLLSKPELISIIDSDVVWDEIKSIEFDGIEETYDIEVENTHNFIANDIVIHNSFALTEIAKQALFRGFNVAFFNFEMEEDFWIRLISSITGSPTDKKDINCRIPFFDCYHNQQGDCDKCPNRVQGKMINNAFAAPDDYKACKICEGNQRKSRMSFIRVISNHLNNKPILTPSIVSKKIKALKTYAKGRIRVQSWPSDTKSIKDIENQLYLWEKYEDFVVDLIETDYADLMVPDNLKLDYRIGLDNIWKGHKRLGQNFNAAVVSATQTKIDTYEKKIKKSSASETKTKNAHIDRAVALNQSTDEYEKGIMRWSMLFERKAKVSSRDIVVLQQLAIGNAYLDSYVDDYKSDEPDNEPKTRKRR